ncbi:MAG: DUF354 domain-containing protein [Deltaproteobacteria bacterium]|nr:DUF354 domain-containing protein [Deltaproteobacteria bacterium]
MSIISKVLLPKKSKKDVLITVNHPAHVHLLKNFISDLRSNNISYLIVARDKDVTLKLLKHLELDYILAPRPRLKVGYRVEELFSRAILLNRLHREFRFRIAIGSDTSIAHVAGLPSFIIAEDDDDYTRLFGYITYPFTYRIINPINLRHSRWQNKRIFHKSYHELAYLHPDNFSPELSVLQKYGLQERKYIVVRFSALGAYHDAHAKGITFSLWSKIKKLLKDYIIIESIEKESNNMIDPWDMHHILASAKMIIGDSQTMTIEGAVLGVPSFRINTFVGKSSILQELEEKYQLAIGILPHEERSILDKINELLTSKDIEEIWKCRRQRLLVDKVDFNQWLIRFFSKYLYGELES